MEDTTTSEKAALLIAALHGPAPTIWWQHATKPEGPITTAGFHRRPSEDRTDTPTPQL